MKWPRRVLPIAFAVAVMAATAALSAYFGRPTGNLERISIYIAAYVVACDLWETP